MFVVRRHPENPLLSPQREHPWEALATFNPSVVKTETGVKMYYRAFAHPAALIAPFAPQSTIGVADSEDGVHFHSQRQVITPKEAWEAFGCEDPRATVIDGVTYLSYTALGGYPFNADNIRVAIAVSKDGEHFDERHLATPFNAKAFALFPEKVGDKYAALLTVHTDQPPSKICLALADSIEDYWNPDYWMKWYADWESHALEFVRSDKDHVEAGAVPIKTERGWLFFYSYIEHYFGDGRRVFGIEAALLDAADPMKVSGRTYPFLVPEEIYERYGVEPEIVFPTSALDTGDGMIDLYYGAADTTVAKATIRTKDLLDSIDTSVSPVLMRALENPILLPRKENAFEAKLVFNPAAIDLEGSIHILYRAMSEDNTSYVGYARSEDGLHIDERLPVPIYGPRADFEMKLSHPTGNSGCEDPRAVVIDGRIYMTYTAYDGIHAPRGAVSSISTEDFLAKKFDAWTEPFLVTPDDVDDKDLALLPEKTADGHFMLYHRISGRICADILPDLTSGTRISRCIEIMGPREGMWDAAKVGMAGPLLKVDGGWLMLYHGVS
ncbi:MAG TPA: hypothetical protein PK109_03190, partial [Candidatus Paceibacterota bacterium]|nr:hypothetical protein [Candidatus Paceibacterota bacterium]